MKFTLRMKVLTLLFSFNLIPSCVTNSDSHSVDNPSLQEDSEYFKEYQRSSRSEDVVVNFENRVQLTATYLSPEFRHAIAKRYETLFDTPQPILEEASNKAGFFVSAFSPEEEGYDLTDDRLWSITLKTDDKTLKPIMIKRIHQKQRWQPFFAAVHNWSREYLVLFDTASVSTGNKMVKKERFTLQLAHADAKLKLQW